MVKKWYESDNSLLTHLEAEIEKDFPGLRVVNHSGKIVVKGRFDVFTEEGICDSYAIEVVLSDDHPVTMPRVFETGRRIPRIAARHIYPKTGNACLFVPFERKEYWPDERSISQLLGGAVNSYFYCQSVFEREGHFPFGERSHDLLGILESIQERAAMPNLSQTPAVIEILTKPQIKGHWLCPCASGLVIRNCKHELALRNLSRLLAKNESKLILSELELVVKEMHQKRKVRKNFNESEMTRISLGGQ